MTYPELQEFFTNYPPRKNLMINPSATLVDPELILETCYLRIGDWKGDLNKCPSFWLLKELYHAAKADMIKKEAF